MFNTEALRWINWFLVSEGKSLAHAIRFKEIK